MGLAEYRKKRTFTRTPEPAGKVARRRRARRVFVVQKHAASRLHYDFRLESDGVLKSWAVPKGPSLDPKERRLAVEVEDHPLEYGSFEGTIPKGQYGGGSVLLWDRGEWEPEGDASEGLRRGKLKFRLQGEKLRGGWTLVRMGKDDDAGKPNWLLMKERDDEARGGDITAERPESVASGREIEDIGARDKVWNSDRETDPPAARRPAAKPRKKPARLELPRFVEPQLATLVTAAPPGEEWLHEIKLDGYRVLAAIAGGKARLWTRSGLDWTAKFADVAEALAALPVASALLDGEIVALDASGRSSFQALQRALGGGGEPLRYFIFDLLERDGEDRRGEPLVERKVELTKLLAASGGDTLRLSDHVVGSGERFFAQACKLGVEGVVAKRADSPYRSGRNRDWLKIKCLGRQEFVIGGYSEPQGSRQGIGALLVGVHDGAKLRYAGKVGTGFAAASLRELERKMSRLERRDSPFENPPRGAAARGVHWIEPKLVAEVAFTEWTADGRLRHPSFQGLREDKPAADVRRESPQAAATKATAKKPRSPARSRTPASVSPVAGVTLSNPDRVLFPEQGLTKLDLARYYAAVEEWILPHIGERPLMLVRCPQGRGKHCFYQKHLKDESSPAVHAVDIQEDSGENESYLYVRDLAGVISLVQLGTLEFHGWGARQDDVDKPDRLVFDLDPDAGLGWEAVVEAAAELRSRLAAAGLETWVQTTGGKGVHVIAPIQRRHDWTQVKPFCRAIAEAMAADSPARYISQASKAARRGKIFIDWLRNGRGATAIVPYSSRARAGAPVATPIEWRDLPRTRPDVFSVETLPATAARRRDPWRDFFKVRQSLSAAALRQARRAT